MASVLYHFSRDFKTITSLKTAHQNKLQLDFLVLCLLFIIGLNFAFSTITNYRNLGNQPAFYQLVFEPAVNFACGKGFAIYNTPNESLYQFLHLETNHFDCKKLPQYPAEVSQFVQKSWFYLLGSVGLIWKLTGVSWTSVDGFVAVLFAITITLCYGIFRLGMGPVLATPLTLLICASPLNNSFLPFLRDYGKVPFILAIFFILGLLVKIPIKKYGLLILASLCGVLIGIGYGFRPDLLITIPPVILTILFLIPGGTFANLPWKILASIIMLLTFYIVALPILSSNLHMGSGTFHFPLLGLMKSFDLNLGIIPSIYEFGHQYNDALVDTMVNSYGFQYLHLNSIGYCTKNYDIASGSLYMQIIKSFPADMLTRGYASATQILNLGFKSQPMAILLPDDFLVLMYQKSRPILGMLKGCGILFAFIVPFLTTLFQLRIGIFLILFLSYFTFYPAIQFDPRHFLHLEFISLWMIGYLIYHSFKLTYSCYNKNFSETKIFTSRDVFLKKLKATGMVSLVFLGVGFMVIMLAQTIQRKNIKKLINTYETAEKQVIVKSITEESNESTLITFDSSPNITQINIPRSEMLLIEVLGDYCPHKEINFTLEYSFDPKYPAHNLANKITITTPPFGEKAFVYIPAYQSQHFKPKGISTPTTQTTCIKNIYTVKNLEHYPLWLTLKLPYNYKTNQKFRTNLRQSTK